MDAIWNANPDVNTLYCFKDGNCFVKISDAQSYKKETGKNFETIQRNALNQKIESIEIQEQENEQLEKKPTKKRK